LFLLLFQLAPGGDQVLGGKPDRLRNSGKIRLMSLEKPDQARQKLRLARSRPKLICPDSGQVKEPLRSPFVTKRRG
jgi:hypothetical protein